MSRHAPPQPDGAVVTLSVRSALEAALRAAGVGAGARVLLAPNVAAMTAAAQRTGAAVVQVDVDPSTLAPDIASCDAATTPDTRALVVADLFGGRPDLRATLAWARRRGLLVVEDRAQSLGGPVEPPHVGGPDVLLYSFGALKISGGIGGALAVASDAALLERMRALVVAAPGAPWQWVSRRAFVCASLAAARAAALVRATSPMRDAVCAGWLAADARTLKPPPGLEAVVAAHARAGELTRTARVEAARRLIAAMPPGVLHVGGAAPAHTHWAVPLAVENPDELTAALRRRGYAATRSLVAFGPLAPRASAVFGRIVFLPFFPALDDRALEEVARIVERASITRAGSRSPSLPHRPRQAPSPG
jgi:dTDP-4-amino-4,6-dideoxygalactose transaminase